MTQLLLHADAYMGPGQTTSPNSQTDWLTFAGTSHVPSITVNNGNGPGSSLSSTWATAISGVQATGTKVFGYVNTNGHSCTSSQAGAQRMLSGTGTTYWFHDSLYGVNTSVLNSWTQPDSIYHQIQNWYNWYGVDGIYFDNVYGNGGTYDDDNYNFYADCHNAVKSVKSTMLTQLGCGGNIPEKWCDPALAGNTGVAIFDRCSIMEIAFNGSNNTFSVQSFISKYPRSYFTSSLYSGSANITRAQMQAYLDSCCTNNIGYCYATDHSGYVNFPGIWYDSGVVKGEASYIATKTSC